MPLPSRSKLPWACTNAAYSRQLMHYLRYPSLRGARVFSLVTRASDHSHVHPLCPVLVASYLDSPCVYYGLSFPPYSRVYLHISSSRVWSVPYLISRHVVATLQYTLVVTRFFCHPFPSCPRLGSYQSHTTNMSNYPIYARMFSRKSLNGG